MMTQTVKVSVMVAGVELTKNENGDVVGEEKVISWMGSGVILEVDSKKGKGESLVMTAGHVSNVPPMIAKKDDEGNLQSLFLVQASMTVIETLDGKTCLAEAVYYDGPHDLGVIQVFCVAGRVAELADGLPPIGSAISVSGAGLGYHPAGLFLVEDGRYLGLADGRDPDVVMSVPVVGGHSGSGVFHHGKVIGIVTKVFTRFEHGSFATGVDHVRRALEAARENRI